MLFVDLITKNPAGLTDLRLRSQCEQNIVPDDLRHVAARPAGEPVQLLPARNPRALRPAQESLERAHVGPGHRALVVIPVEERHRDPAGGRHQRHGADLEERGGGAGQRLPAGTRGAAAAAHAGQQLPRLLAQDVAEQQQRQGGHEQEHHPVEEVQVAAGTIEDRRGEDLLPSRREQRHQAEAEVGLFVGKVQNSSELVHL